MTNKTINGFNLTVLSAWLLSILSRPIKSLRWAFIKQSRSCKAQSIWNLWFSRLMMVVDFKIPLMCAEPKTILESVPMDLKGITPCKPWTLIISGILIWYAKLIWSGWVLITGSLGQATCLSLKDDSFFWCLKRTISTFPV